MIFRVPDDSVHLTKNNFENKIIVGVQVRLGQSSKVVVSIGFCAKELIGPPGRADSKLIGARIVQRLSIHKDKSVRRGHIRHE